MCVFKIELPFPLYPTCNLPLLHYRFMWISCNTGWATQSGNPNSEMFQSLQLCSSNIMSQVENPIPDFWFKGHKLLHVQYWKYYIIVPSSYGHKVHMKQMTFMFQLGSMVLWTCKYPVILENPKLFWSPGFWIRDMQPVPHRERAEGSLWTCRLRSVRKKNICIRTALLSGYLGWN